MPKAVAALALLLTGAPLLAQVPLPSYTIEVGIDPATSEINVTGRLENACAADSLRLYLNKHFRLEEVRDSAGRIPTYFDTAGTPLPYTDVTRRVIMERTPCTFSFQYRGQITDTLMNVNMVTPDLVELASYSGWYFESPDFRQIRFDVTATLPAGWFVTGNGREVSAEATSGYTRVRFTDAGPGFDIVLVAAPSLRKTSHTSVDGVLVEILSPPADSEPDESVLANLVDALGRYSSWYGPAATRGALRVVYSPRGGWGYSRIPLIISSAAYRNRQLAGPLGPIRVMQGATHELAHFWWSIADVATGDDWINEGLAEYSALAAVTARFGQIARDSLLAVYRRDAARSQTTATIAATPAQSPDRYVNRYEKPALLLAELDSVYGLRMREALGLVYTRFRGTRAATTAEVLSIMGGVLGPGAEARLRACVVAIAWRERCPD
jgi:hypothetical protein